MTDKLSANMTTDHELLGDAIERARVMCNWVSKGGSPYNLDSHDIRVIVGEIDRLQALLASGWYLPRKPLNDLQIDSVNEQIKRCRQAHFTNIQIRINGEFEIHEADWIKHMKPLKSTGEL